MHVVVTEYNDNWKQMFRTNLIKSNLFLSMS